MRNKQTKNRNGNGKNALRRDDRITRNDNDEGTTGKTITGDHS